MPHHPFKDVVSSVESLREIMGTPSELVIRKQLDRLDPHAIAFIARSPFLVIGTHGQGQIGDVSPRGDAPGFVAVLDEHTLVIPERPGNRRLDTLLNVLQTGGVGLIFMVPGVEETLRINGRACIVRDEALLERMSAKGKRPLLGIGVEVQECFFHCAKAFKRSGLWQPGSWRGRDGMASLAQILVDQIKPANTSVDELENQIADSYATRLY
jgi:uncharacterized protein